MVRFLGLSAHYDHDSVQAALLVICIFSPVARDVQLADTAIQIHTLLLRHERDVDLVDEAKTGSITERGRQINPICRTEQYFPAFS